LGAAASSIHLPAISKLQQLEIVGGCDPQQLGGQRRFPVFASAEELLERIQPDLVVIATPPSSHFELVRLGLAAGCHVFCEKPLTETLAQANELSTLAAQAGRCVFVNSEFPWMSIHSAAKRAMNADEFGRLQFVSMHQTFVVTKETEHGWRGEEVQRTFKEFGTHVLDLACYFFDEYPKALRARMPRPAGRATPDLLNIIELEFSGDRFALIVLDRLNKGRHRYLDIRLDGERAAIETSIGGRLRASAGIHAKSRSPFLDFDFALGGRARFYRGERHTTLATAPLDLFASATALLLGEALSAIERGDRPPCALPESIRTLEMLLACYESAADLQTREFGT
jgi:predicted dehydrogenase